MEIVLSKGNSTHYLMALVTQGITEHYFLTLVWHDRIAGVAVP